jgi:site-specific DNA-methyltransferase (adenine-specific)
MRFFMATADRFAAAGWRYAQDVVWEKQNGSGWAADRFKRVHEHAVQFYLADAPWGGVFNEVQKTHGHKKLKVSASRQGAAHAGSIKKGEYVSDGERIMRSVIPLRSCHGHAIHPTEKPVGLLQTLIRTSCPPGGLVGDFFAGSGAGGEAAATAGRKYVGAEVDPDMADKARQRLASNLFGAAA